MYEVDLNGHGQWEKEEKKDCCTGDQKEDILITELYENIDKNHA